MAWAVNCVDLVPSGSTSGSCNSTAIYIPKTYLPLQLVIITAGERHLELFDVCANYHERMKRLQKL